MTDVFQVLFGLTKPTAGEVVYKGRTAPPRSPFEAIRNGSR